jgi:cob(I)alamin adenosyltransferase
MSITTKTGDKGSTGLMYNRRVSKCHPRVEACGAVAELNAAIGLARAAGPDRRLAEQLLGIQKDLITLMGEMATQARDLPRYVKDGYALVTPQLTAKLDAIVREIEAGNISFKGWAAPGANPVSAALDVARATCRRAERRACALRESGEIENVEIIIYMNRLSDALWLMARRAGQTAPGSQ